MEEGDERISPDVRVRIYHPPNAHGRKLPLVLFCHGGGWFSGTLDTEDHTCRVVSGGVDCVVVTVEYRLTPNVKYPVLVDDCLAGFQWVRAARPDLFHRLPIDDVRPTTTHRTSAQTPPASSSGVAPPAEASLLASPTAVSAASSSWPRPSCTPMPYLRNTNTFLPA